MLHLCQFWFSKLLIELYLAHWLLLEQGSVADKLRSILLFVPGCKLYYDVIVVCVLCVLSRNIRWRRSEAYGKKTFVNCGSVVCSSALWLCSLWICYAALWLCSLWIYSLWILAVCYCGVTLYVSLPTPSYLAVNLVLWLCSPTPLSS